MNSSAANTLSVTTNGVKEKVKAEINATNFLVIMKETQIQQE